MTFLLGFLCSVFVAACLACRCAALEVRVRKLEKEKRRALYGQGYWRRLYYRQRTGRRRRKSPSGVETVQKAIDAVDQAIGEYCADPMGGKHEERAR